jgi:hypothetical protein
MVVIGLVVAFTAIPSWRRSAVHASEVTVSFFGKLFGF